MLCLLHYSGQRTFRREIEFELDLIGGINMSEVITYKACLRHSEVTCLSGAEKALIPEHSELWTASLGVWAPSYLQWAIRKVSQQGNVRRVAFQKLNLATNWRKKRLTNTRLIRCKFSTSFLELMTIYPQWWQPSLVKEVFKNPKQNFLAWNLCNLELKLILTSHLWRGLRTEWPTLPWPPEEELESGMETREQ